MSSVLLLVATVALRTQAAPPQSATPPKGTGILAGQIVDAQGAGVPDAIVTLQGGIRPIALTTTNREIPGGPRATRTTSEGRFAFFDLTPGSYAVDASKAGFITGAYGRMRPGGQAHSITLGDAEVQTSVRIRIWEYAAVSGTVRDEAGEPVVGVAVRALQRAVVHGKFQFISGPQTTTDDRGQYRIETLQPGRYVVAVTSTQAAIPGELLERFARLIPSDPEAQVIRSAVSRGGGAGGRQVGGALWTSSRSALAVPDPDDGGRLRIYPTTFHPAAPSTRAAQMLTLASGEHRTAVDIDMSLVPAAMVSGAVTAGGAPMTGVLVRLVPEYAEDLSGGVGGFEAATSVCDERGRFAFVGVPAGRYFFQAEAATDSSPASAASPAAARQGWLNEPITVGEDGLSGLNLPLRPAVRISGRIAFEGTKPPPSPELIERLVVSIETIGFAVNRAEAPYQANFDKNGHFVLPAVPPGRYVMTFRAAIADRQAMPDWETRDVSVAGRNISDRPWIVTHDVSDVIVTLTNNNTEVNGVIRDAAGRVEPGAAVLLFTTEQDLWTVRMPRRIRALRTSETGAFSVRGVPPGDYHIVAIPDADLGDFPDPAMLSALARIATRISVTAGAHVTQNLIVRPVK